MCILFVNDQQRANHYGEYAVQFDKALLDDGSFDPKIAKGLNHIVFTRREVTELQEDSSNYTSCWRNWGLTPPTCISSLIQGLGGLRRPCAIT